MKCVFCGILNHNNKNVSLHKFPRDEPQHKEWLKLIGLDGLSVRDNTRLCSNHFTKDCFIEHHCNRRSLKPGSVPTIFKREARFQKQQAVSVETNFTDKAQDVATMSKKENDEPRRNILIEINSIDNDTGPASITEQIPEASTIVGYSELIPTTS
ncbi:uncharacterized protein LOC143219281 isoform X2 [Lasioglossum baleicum]|uniref:uncharacterized protein LOC143219281 isoform X2 n=1 Tax=Lasioglossum baleicum TaxID=434251 RepID=UPI003FCCA1AB